MMKAAAIARTSRGDETVVAVFLGPTQDAITEIAQRWISASGRLIPIPEKMDVDTASDLFDSGVLEMIGKVQRELDAGRSVVVVYPTHARAHNPMMVAKKWFGRDRTGLFYRYSTVLSGLMALRVDTVVMVDYEDFNPEAIPYINDLTRTVMNPRQISI